MTVRTASDRQRRALDAMAHDGVVPKADVHYGPGKGADRCRNCKFFLGEICRIVVGRIDPNGWCDEFMRNPLGALDGGGIAAGVLFVSPEGRVLLLRRSLTEENFAGHWALPGGKADAGETPDAAARRESREEMGDDVPDGELISVDEKTTPTGMTFHTFAQRAPAEFAPKLNPEHVDFKWVSLDDLPAPLHPAVVALLKSARDAIGEDGAAKQGPWQKVGKIALKMPTFLNNPAKPGMDANYGGWTTGQLEAALQALIRQWKPKPGDEEPANMREIRAELKRRREAKGADDAAIAFDRATVREVDTDGRMRVAITNISKANVCPYFGREIPDAAALGLDPNRTYRLLRDPDELAKGAATFNNLPLLSEHVPVNADEHRKDLVIGATGTDAEFAKPYLRNSLVVWTQDAIDAIEDEAQKELSCGYHYRADMTPGTYEGQGYDGVMRDIVGNHVALVKKGRAGPDVVVGDSAIVQPTTEITTMRIKLSRTAAVAKGALLAFLSPRLAADASIDLSDALKDVTGKNLVASRPKIVAAVSAAVKGKLAKDADVNGLEKLIEGVKEEEDEPPAEDDEPTKFLKEKLGDDGYKAYDAMRRARDASIEEMNKAKAEKDGQTSDSPPPFTGMPKVGGGMDKAAMDAAIATAVSAGVKTANENARAIRVAERACRPYVGDLAVDHDSEEAVYRATLKTLGVKGIDGVHASALPALLAAQPVPGAKPQRQAIATDEAAARSYHDRFPNAGRLRAV